MIVEIDKNSGFCFGVINAIRTAEKWLAENDTLYCLGDIVHNNEEVRRLAEMGLVIVTPEEFRQLHDTKVLIRAHGEPPETYQIAQERHIELIDATCHVVLKLQQNIKQQYEQNKLRKGQILIFGRKGHAEVVGLWGQTHQQGIVVSSRDDLEKVDFSKPATLYSQTTQSPEEYAHIVHLLKTRYAELGRDEDFTWHDTICRTVANRSKQICEFASHYDKVVFVSGEKSSNGLHLFHLCKDTNSDSYFVSKLEQLKEIPFRPTDRVGICGATSTPMWLMEKAADKLMGIGKEILNSPSEK